MNTAVRKIDVKKEAADLLSKLGVDASASPRRSYRFQPCFR